MIVHDYRIPYKLGETKRILMMSDIHYGNTQCDERAAKKKLNEDPEQYILLNGDQCDAIVLGDKRYTKDTDSTKGPAIIDEQVNELSEWLMPHRNRIIGIADGNHELKVLERCGSNMTERICEKLDVKYTGFSSFINLRFSENGARGRTLTIRMIHGWGAGARTRGAALTKYSRDIGLWLADVYYYAHDHLLQQDRIQQQKPCGKTIVARPKWVILGGTYLKSYSSTTHAPYSEQKGYASVELGSPVLHVKPNNKWLEVWTDLGHATVIE